MCRRVIPCSADVADMRGSTQLTLSFYALLTFMLAQAFQHEFVAAWTLFGCSQIVIGLRTILEAIERK